MPDRANCGKLCGESVGAWGDKERMGPVDKVARQSCTA
jgi:hypothetical protein